MDQLESLKSIDIPIITKLTILFEKTNSEVGKFPKFVRFSLGEKILNNNLEVIELVFKSAIATKYEKEKYLLNAQSKNELLKILIRLSHQSEYIDYKKYLEIQSLLQEIGKMINGWLKYARNN